MDRKATHCKTAAILTGLLLLLLACNLGTSENAPPTLAPLPTFTPRATLGYVAAGPVAVVEIGVTPAPASDAEMERILERVESDRLMAHIRSLQDLRTRHVDSSQSSEGEGIGAARKYIEDQLAIFSAASDNNLYTFQQRFDAWSSTPDSRTTQFNVVGAIRGTELNAGTIIIGAHYDSIGTPRSDPGAYAPGANDNASGVAAVLELARIMSEAQYKATVMFVFFSAEEFDRRGSRAFASWVQDNNIDVIGMINLDGIGNVQDFEGRVNDLDCGSIPLVLTIAPSRASWRARSTSWVTIMIWV